MLRKRKQLSDPYGAAGILFPPRIEKCTKRRGLVVRIALFRFRVSKESRHTCHVEHSAHDGNEAFKSTHRLGAKWSSAGYPPLNQRQGRPNGLNMIFREPRQKARMAKTCALLRMFNSGVESDWEAQ